MRRCGAGASVSLTPDERPAGTVAFDPGTRRDPDLIAGPAPMWFTYSSPGGLTPEVYVGDVVCGEARPYTGRGFVPQ